MTIVHRVEITLILQFIGNTMQRISDGFYSALCTQNGCLYAIKHEVDERHFIDVYSIETWKKISVIPIKFTGESHVHTLCVNKHHMFVACANSHCIYKMSLEGKEPVKCGKFGVKLGEFINPLACMCDDDDNLLTADFGNNRLQLLHGKQWSKIELKPHPFDPEGAVYDGHAIYVLGFNPCQILKYECVE